MKTTDHELFVVLDENELQSVNGGGLLVGFVVGLLISELLDPNAINDFKNGFEAGWADGNCR